MKMIEKTDGDCNVILVPEETYEDVELPIPNRIDGSAGPSRRHKYRHKRTDITPKKKKRK